MEVLFWSAAFFFDPLLALGDAAMCRACWGVFSLVISFYGNYGAKFLAICRRSAREAGHARKTPLNGQKLHSAISVL
jgi:hypothetical protein